MKLYLHSYLKQIVGRTFTLLKLINGLKHMDTSYRKKKRLSLCGCSIVEYSCCKIQVILVFSYRCVCNIDCSGYSFNPVCASDGSSYNNPCFVREASCIKQEQIDIRHLGHCTGKIYSTYPELFL